MAVFQDFSALSTILGYSFQNPKLLQEALTHSSLSRTARNNQRLEFLGDRVLGLVVAGMLFDLKPALPEGELALRQGTLVSQEILARIANHIDLGRYMRLAHGEKVSGGSYKPSALADCLEAILAALYLDGGMDAPAHFIKKHWTALLDTIETRQKDPKSALQEWSQGHGHGTPLYEIRGRTGPDHAPLFTIAVRVGEFPPVLGAGDNKRLAEQNAATLFLDTIIKKVPKSQ